jgi:hypothetical protein
MAKAEQQAKAPSAEQELLAKITETVEEMGRDHGGIPAPISQRINRLRELCGLVV